jgi:hypothetical protein
MAIQTKIAEATEGKQWKVAKEGNLRKVGKKRKVGKEGKVGTGPCLPPALMRTQCLAIIQRVTPYPFHHWLPQSPPQQQPQRLNQWGL